MATVTQSMKYRQSLTRYAPKHGVSRASRNGTVTLTSDNMYASEATFAAIVDPTK